MSEAIHSPSRVQFRARARARVRRAAELYDENARLRADNAKLRCELVMAHELLELMRKQCAAMRRRAE